MSNALHELTITLLKRQHEQELEKVKAERDKFMNRLMEMNAEYDRVSVEKTQMLRQLRFICERIDLTREELKDICKL